MHTLERALFAYAETRNAAAQRSAARVAHPKTGDKKLFRHPTDPASVANVEEKDNAAEPQVVNVSNFITLPVTGESSPTATWDHSALADEDSDDAGGNKSDNMTREVLSVRNSRFMEKHRIQVGASAKAPKGQGLFAKENGGGRDPACERAMVSQHARAAEVVGHTARREHHCHAFGTGGASAGRSGVPDER